jgi:hypothetical protein
MKQSLEENGNGGGVHQDLGLSVNAGGRRPLVLQCYSS